MPAEFIKVNHHNGGIMKSTACSAVALSLFIILVISGCKKDDNPAGGGNPSPTATQPSAPTPTTFNGVTPANVMAVIRTSATQSVPGIGTILVDQNVATALFGSPGTDKGTVTVTVGSSNYGLGKLSASGNISYIHPDPANPTSLITMGSSATAVAFNVSGMAAVNGSVTVPGQVRITAPAVDASVPRNAALNVTWTVTGGNGSRHAIFIADAAGHSVFKDGVPAGSASFTAAEMGTLSAGTAWVYALTYNFNLTSSNTAVIIGEAVAVHSISLQ